MDEKLRFVIDLQNKASAELQKLSKDFASVKPTAGMKNTASWFQTLEGASTASTKALRPLIGGLGMVGAGGLAAGLSVAGLVQQFRDLARAMPAMQELSRQTGISKTELARLQYAASRLHLDPSQMTNAIGSWSTGMVQFSKATGEVYFEMQNGSAGLAQKIAKEWRDHPEAAFKDTLAWLAAIPEAQRRAGKSAQEAAQIQKYWVGKTLGDEGMAQFFGKGMGGITSALDEAAKRVAPITDDMERAAEKFDDSITNLNTSWANIVRDLGPSFLDPLSHTIDHLDEVIKAGERMFQHAPEPEPARKPDGKAGETIPEWLARVGRNTLRAQFNGSGLAADGEAAVNALGSLFGVGEAKAGELPGGRSGAARGMVQFDDDRLSRARAGDVPAAHTMLAPPRGLDYRAVLDFLDPNLGNAVLGPEREPAPSLPSGTSPSAAGFHPDDDRASRARASDAPDRSLDGFVVGELGQEVVHLRNTLRTAAKPDSGPVHQAAFHGAGFNGLAAGLDPEATIAAGTRRGFVDAFREIQGMQDLDGKGGGGFMPTSFGGGGLGGGYSPAAAGRAPNLRYGRQHDGAPYSPADGGAVPTGAHTPLKDLIAQHETGGTGAAGYDTVYGHAEQPGSKMAAFAPPKPVTQMTIGEILAYQRDMKARAHSEAFPVGRAQWVERTLRTITHGMDPNTVFTPEVQEKLFDRSIAGRLGQGVGGFQSEWDSLKRVPLGQIQAAIAGHQKAMADAAAAAPTALAGPRGAYPGWMDDRSKREMAGINAPLARELLAASEATGTHFRILQGMRSEAEAAHNAFTGRGVVNSQHRWGAAADIKLTDAQGHDLDRGGYANFAQAFQAYSKAHGGNSRWLGGIGGRWSSDIAHFDQGLGYGQSHARDPYGTGGPTADDVKAGAFEIFRSSDNPFTKAAKPLGDAADKLKAAVAPMPEVKPEPPRLDAIGGQQARMDPLHIHMTHTEGGRTRVAVKHGEGVKVSLRTAPTMVQTG